MARFVLGALVAGFGAGWLCALVALVELKGVELAAPELNLAFGVAFVALALGGLAVATARTSVSAAVGVVDRPVDDRRGGGSG